jgi:metal-responsive CopG/Arc/MetJ family transcriptional regulator
LNKKQKDRTVNSFCTGITLPLNVLETVDSIRKDIPRSRFILRLIEKSLLQSGVKVGAQNQTAAVEVIPASNETKEQYDHVK